MKDWHSFCTRVRQAVDRHFASLIRLRRDFHAHPELAFQEIRTARVVADWLTRLGLEVQTRVGKTGVVGRLDGRPGGPTVALRADMDALPLQEEGEESFRSQVDGVMHACGHDAHTAMLLVAATILAEWRREWPGRVVFLFQPAEEGAGGAIPMIEEGVLEGVDVIFAQHVTPFLEPGYVALTPGAALAACDDFTLTIYGKPGHAGYPHQAVDAIQVAAQVMVGLQPLLSRQVDPMQRATVTIGRVEGGTAGNMIAGKVILQGTIRTFDPLMRERIPQRIEEMSARIASAYGGSIAWSWRPGCPVLVNTERESRLVAEVAQTILGCDHFLHAPPAMGGDDFACFLQHVPGCYWWLGAMPPRARVSDLALHHPRFALDERALGYGVEMLVMSTLAYLWSSSHHFRHS